MPRPHADPRDVVDLLRHQVEALFTHDPAGRIVSKNKPVYAPAPRVFIGKCLAGNLWRLRDDVPDDLAAALVPMLDREPPLGRLDGLPTLQTELVADLARHAPIRDVNSGPAWWVPERLPSPTRAVLIGPDHVDALRPNFPFALENLPAISPCAAVIDDGVAVSICFSARQSATVVEAGLDTIATARGRGYGPDAVAAWAAAKLGLIQYAIDLSIY